VVLTSGLGGTWLDWISVVPLLAARHEVVRFDRPGLGYSPPVSRGPTLRAEADRIAALVRSLYPGERAPASYPGERASSPSAPASRASERGRTRSTGEPALDTPVIVAAHSMAAFHAEAFARLYPQLTGGLVLVDPSYEPETDFLPAPMRGALSELGSRAGLLSGRAAGVLGLARALAPPARSLAAILTSVRHVDPVPPADARAAYGTGEAVGATLAELACYRWQAVDLARLREGRAFPAVPLVVLAATGRLRSDEARRRWTSRTQQIARMTPAGRHVEIANSGHLVSFDRPDAIADAIEAVTAAMPGPAGDVHGNRGL
jgi:pimeloyl-ACP methyl ester carboxylesterase